MELSYEVAIDGNGILHTDSLTETQKQAVESAQYNYHTLEKETDGTGVPV